ncbi:hypothetical protein R1sor_005201 [Riccia sorocarpa]|uniref:Uncharacterized protein n=1 Tax=Riccia sorocarpa TaxID=122646 RepID=A0ABD3HN82_9MARC
MKKRRKDHPYSRPGFNSAVGVMDAGVGIAERPAFATPRYAPGNVISPRNGQLVPQCVDVYVDNSEMAMSPVTPLTRVSEIVGPIQIPETRAEKEQGGDRNAKLLRKRTETKETSNGEFRQDLQFAMDDKWVAVYSNLMDVIQSLKKKKQAGRQRTPIPAIDEVAKMCKRLKVAGRRPRPFIINGQKMDRGADLIMIDIPTGRAIASEKDVPLWNRFPVEDNYPRHLLNLAGRLLDDVSSTGFGVVFLLLSTAFRLLLGPEVV